MIHNTIIAKLFNCNWSERNKNKPVDSIDITMYNDKTDGELILLELSRKGKPITHITLSKKQLVAVIQMNNAIQPTPMLPDVKGKPNQEITCGLNRPR